MLRLLRLLLVSLSTATLASAAISDIPIITKSVQCNSELLRPGGDFATLTPEIEFHWKLLDSYVLEAAIRYKGRGWVGLGFSPNGSMVGSKAVIGVPDSNGLGKPVIYDLKGQNVSAVTESTYNYHVEGTVIQVKDLTTMVFQTNNWHTAHYEDGLYTFIVAVGSDNTLGFHKHAAAFRVDLLTCKGSTDSDGQTAGDTPVPSANAGYNHRAAFVVHGVFATLAFAVVIPAAVASALFRSLMPKMWIYAHVICNCLGFLFTVIAVASAFGGMVMRSKASGSQPSHLDRIHHWVGLILFVTIAWQVLNGFQRPPVEPKPELKTTTDYDMQDEITHKTTCCCISKPESPRERWQFVHRLSAITIIALAIYQLQAGIKLYVLEYAVGISPSGLLTGFWIWIVMLVVAFVSLRCIVSRRERRHSQMFRPGRNIMPQREEEVTSYRDNQFNVI